MCVFYGDLLLLCWLVGESGLPSSGGRIPGSSTGPLTNVVLLRVLGWPSSGLMTHNLLGMLELPLHSGFLGRPCRSPLRVALEAS